MRNRIPEAQIAEEFMSLQLQSRGWNILERNFRRPRCEIDIIAEKNSTLIFLEVKYRKANITTLDQAQSLVNPKKAESLKLGASLFLSTQDKTWDQMRFDLAIVSKKSPTKTLSFEYFANIF